MKRSKCQAKPTKEDAAVKRLTRILLSGRSARGINVYLAYATILARLVSDKGNRRSLTPASLQIQTESADHNPAQEKNAISSQRLGRSSFLSPNHPPSKTATARTRVHRQTCLLCRVRQQTSVTVDLHKFPSAFALFDRSARNGRFDLVHFPINYKVHWLCKNAHLSYQSFLDLEQQGYTCGLCTGRKAVAVENPASFTQATYVQDRQQQDSRPLTKPRPVLCCDQHGVCFSSFKPMKPNSTAETSAKHNWAALRQALSNDDTLNRDLNGAIQS